MALSRTLLCLAATLYSASAYSGASSFASRPRGMTTAARRSGKSSLRMESFGFDFAEDQAANTPQVILGEKNLKEGFVPKVREDALLTSDYPILDRVSELGLLSLTAESGMLQALTDKGLTLSDVEKLLPLIEEFGLLTSIQNPLLLNLVAPLLVEPAPLLLPGVVGLVKTDPAVFLALAGACASLEAYGISTSGDLSPLPLVGAALFGGIGLLLGNIGSGEAVRAPAGPKPVMSRSSRPKI